MLALVRGRFGVLYLTYLQQIIFVSKKQKRHRPDRLYDHPHFQHGFLQVTPKGMSSSVNSKAPWASKVTSPEITTEGIKEGRWNDDGGNEEDDGGGGGGGDDDGDADGDEKSQWCWPWTMMTIRDKCFNYHIQLWLTCFLRLCHVGSYIQYVQTREPIPPLVLPNVYAHPLATDSPFRRHSWGHFLGSGIGVIPSSLMTSGPIKPNALPEPLQWPYHLRQYVENTKITTHPLIKNTILHASMHVRMPKCIATTQVEVTCFNRTRLPSETPFCPSHLSCLSLLPLLQNITSVPQTQDFAALNL